MPVIFWASFTATLVVLSILTILQKKKSLRLPPGPPRRFIVGNLKDLPKPDQQEWHHWMKHKELYGPISSLSVLGKCIIILNDYQLAIQLLEKRSVYHSSRPQQTFADMSGWDNVLGSVRDPVQLRDTRRFLAQGIGSNKSVSRFDQVQKAEAARFLMRVLNAPEKLRQHIQKEAAAVVLKIGYGYTVEPHGEDPLVILANKAMTDFSSAMLPTSWPVNFLPFLKYMPTWMPGSDFIHVARRYKKTVTAFSDVPYNFVKEQMEKQTAVPSFLSNVLSKSSIKPGSQEEITIKWSAGSLYAGGADTTVSSLATFFLAMALFPEVQHKAQQELDTVVGNDRIPEFHDRASLPYVNAVIQEVFRWRPVVPINVAHESTADDVCEGYDIPKGSIILANIWAFTRDESIYHDPMAFKPERFLPSLSGNPPELKPSMIFGFGRRVCAGRLLAETNMFLTVAQSLAVFDISKPLQNGKEEDFSASWLPGVISHPAPFELSIRPRSDKHLEIIRSLERQYPWEKSNARDIGSVVF
ncbi:hypothetical protein ASPZODRAFT_97356 [Penicilliopsis zonata CBS 506.65]|uniref:O-methylsterigmatocystin oxidoreductase n=1 Tax=Penicilliopsis zonata CBS 506.65 TaxID=1073090 RepID=A0A1L9SHW1_9EURO|nr:hypothetical protein ASPZODRAFT_97356 [Penicilliopsis zonata CBS 506.65]OJJ46795.1 hypothetical protein ASPZODRAFT_97356 [Penicilliopsis zonata CBS 506.65]